MAHFIRKIRKKLNLAIIWIEHDMKMVAELADRVVVLDYGRMLATGTANEVLQDPNVVSAYLGTGLSLRKTGDDQNAAQ
jgi:branched-chain amino acid transport system ATP-binding protein